MILEVLGFLELGDCGQIVVIVTEDPDLGEIVLASAEGVDYFQEEFFVFEHPEDVGGIEDFCVEDVFGFQVLEDTLFLAGFQDVL